MCPTVAWRVLIGKGDVLIGYAGSPEARAALRTAIEQAVAFGGRPGEVCVAGVVAQALLVAEADIGAICGVTRERGAGYAP